MTTPQLFEQMLEENGGRWGEGHCAGTQEGRLIMKWSANSSPTPNW